MRLSLAAILCALPFVGHAQSLPTIALPSANLPANAGGSGGAIASRTKDQPGADICLRVRQAIAALISAGTYGSGTVSTYGDPGGPCTVASARGMFADIATTQVGLGTNSVINRTNRFVHLILDATTIQSPVQIVVPFGSSVSGYTAGYAATTGSVFQAAPSFNSGGAFTASVLDTTNHLLTLTTALPHGLVTGDQVFICAASPCTNSSAKFSQFATVVDATHFQFSTFVNCDKGRDFNGCAGGSNYPELGGLYSQITTGVFMTPFFAVGDIQFSERTSADHLLIDMGQVTSTAQSIGAFTQTANENGGFTYMSAGGSRFADYLYDTGNNSATLGARNYDAWNWESGPKDGVGVMIINGGVEDIRGMHDMTINGFASATGAPLAACVAWDGPTGKVAALHFENCTDGLQMYNSAGPAPAGQAGEGLGSGWIAENIAGLYNVTNTVHILNYGTSTPHTGMLTGIRKNGGTNIYVNDNTAITKTDKVLVDYLVP